jgi:hypothetical protein
MTNAPKDPFWHPAPGALSFNTQFVIAKVEEADKALDFGDFSTAREIQAELAGGGHMEVVGAEIVAMAIEAAQEKRMAAQVSKEIDHAPH